MNRLAFQLAALCSQKTPPPPPPILTHRPAGGQGRSNNSVADPPQHPHTSTSYNVRFPSQQRQRRSGRVVYKSDVSPIKSSKKLPVSSDTQGLCRSRLPNKSAKDLRGWHSDEGAAPVHGTAEQIRNRPEETAACLHLKEGATGVVQMQIHVSGDAPKKKAITTKATHECAAVGHTLTDGDQKPHGSRGK